MTERSGEPASIGAVQAQHFVLTKYNTRFGSGIAHRGLDPAWLRTRLELFVSGPLAAIRRQSCPPDNWLIFIDSGTPAGQLRDLAETLGNTGELVMVDGVLTDDRIAEEVHGRLASIPLVLITSRLDSDDVISVDYIEGMRQWASTHRGFINPRYGFQMIGASVLRRRDSSSPFLTYVEEVTPGSTVRTVLSVRHHLAGINEPLKQVAHPRWLQVLHAGNVANQASGLPSTERVAAKYLGFDPLPAQAKMRLGLGRLANAAGKQALSEARWTVRMGWARITRRLNDRA